MDACSNETRYEPVGKIVLRRIGEDVLLVPVSGPAAAGGGCVYPLNETAEAVWTCLVAGGGIGAAVDALVAAYEVSETQARDDVENLVRMLLGEGLIERRG